MKTAEQVRDLIAQKWKYKNWADLNIKVGGSEMESFIDEAMEAYAEQKLLSIPSQEKMAETLNEFARFLKKYDGIRDHATPDFQVRSYLDHKEKGTLNLDNDSLYLTSTGQEAENKTEQK